MKAKGNGPAFILQTYEDRLNNNNSNKELTQKLTERLSNLQNGTEETKRLTLNKTNSVGSTPPPPPPPPQKNGSLDSSTISTPSSSTPSTRSNTLKSAKPKPKAPPVPVKYSVLSYHQSQNNFKNAPSLNGYNSSQNNQPPPCPSPDYDTLSLASTTSSNIVTSKTTSSPRKVGDSAEMESLESFKLNNPTDVKHKPPNTYFQKRALTSTISSQSTISNTSTIRRSRPVSVTIGEYASVRRQPGKLEFLHNVLQDDTRVKKEESLGSRLTSELTQTLNRSNLRKRTESMANPDKG